MKTAVALVKDGLAVADEGQTFLQLTFSKVAHLRDRSLKIDEAFLNAYAEGKRWARVCFDEGWSGRALLPAVTMPDDGRILSFAP